MSTSYAESAGVAERQRGAAVVPVVPSRSVSPISQSDSPIIQPPLSLIAVRIPVISAEATLAEALEFAREHNLLSESGLIEAGSAVRLFAKQTGKKPHELPAAPPLLTPIVEAAFGTRRRCERKRWANMLSSLRRLLRACGLHAPRPQDLTPSDPEWAVAAEALTNPQERSVMKAVGRWASGVGVEIDHFDERALADHIEYRHKNYIRTDLKRLRVVIRCIWNNAVRLQLPGFPDHLIPVPPSRHVEASPLSQFPAAFQADVAAYLSSKETPGPFDEDPRQWRHATVVSARRIIQRAATLEAQRRGGSLHIETLADITSVDAVEFVLRHLHKRAGDVWREYAGNVANRLYLIARDHVRADQATLARLEEFRKIIYARVRAQRKPGLSERVSQKLAPFDDAKLLRDFFRLPGRLYRDAQDLLQGHGDRRPKGVRAAQRFEQGLMLELLQHEPMRRFNLAGINYKEDFARDERDRITRLRISADKTKNGIAIDTPIPPYLAKRITTFGLTRYAGVATLGAVPISPDGSAISIRGFL
jgi:hypothetical protein